MQNNASFLEMIEQPCVIARLTDELGEAFREFREDPLRYVTNALKRNGSGTRRRMLLQVGLTVAILFYAIAFVSMLLFWSFGHGRMQTGESGATPAIFLRLPGFGPKVDVPAGDEDKPGGGGGGRQTIEPPSHGVLPISSLTQLVVAPRPEPPLSPPLLPVIEKVMVDPSIQFKRDDLSLTGLPDATGLTPSAGPGSDGGIGTGSGGGIGPGDGPGIGPGGGGNAGGERFKLGPGRPNSGAPQSQVDERPVLLNRPQPWFTEEARRNKIQGVVRLRILVAASGKVTQVVVTRGLPDGLDLQAVRAAYQMRFKPAMKNGNPVSFWLNNVDVEFNLR